MSRNISGNQGTNSHTVETSFSCFGNVLEKFRRFFRRSNTSESSRLSVQAVDSVRLVYMRRILHSSVSENAYSNQLLNQNTTTEHGSPSTMSIEQEAPLCRRRKSNRPTLEALELALKSYESKHKNILQHTAPPNEKYLSVESITSGLNKKYVGTKQLRRKSKADIVIPQKEYGELIKNDILITPITPHIPNRTITTITNTMIMNRIVNMEGDKIKHDRPTGSSHQKSDELETEEEEKNVCFDVETISFDSMQDDSFELPQGSSEQQTTRRKKVSIKTKAEPSADFEHK